MRNIITILGLNSFYGSVVDEYRGHTVNSFDSSDSEFAFRTEDICFDGEPCYTDIIFTDSFDIAFHKKPGLHFYVTAKKKMGVFTVNIDSFNCHLKLFYHFQTTKLCLIVNFL